MNLNKAFVLGNVTRDPEVRALPSGQQVTSFGIATNRFYTDKEGQKKQEAEFHNVVCFGKLADIASRYLNKGSLVLIEGRIKTRNWINSQGIKQYRTEIIAEGMQLGPKGSGGSTGSNYGKSSFQSPEPEEPKGYQKQEEIPIIEENYTPSTNNDAVEEQKTVSFEDDASDVIVKDIPF
jgi:single-strand DNA-binding protein